MGKMREKIILSTVILFLTILVVMPLCIVFLISIVPRWSTAFPTSFSGEWWLTLLDFKYVKIILNTLIITATSTLITVGYATVASYLFVFFEFKAKSILLIILLSPMYIAGVVLALGLLTVYSQIRNTFWILVLGHFIVISPIVFKYILSAMEKIPSVMIEASYNLGASRFETFIDVIIPLCKNGILAGTILSLGMNISELSVSLLLYGAGWSTLPIQIYLERSWGVLGIAGVLSTILILITITTMVSLEHLQGGNKG